MQAVDRVGGDLHRGLEAERVIGPCQVVVDRLGDAHDVDAVVGQSLGHAERVLTADRDQPVEAELLERGAHALEPVIFLVGVRARCAEDRPAAVEDAAGRLVRQLAGVTGHDAGPAVAEAEELVVVGVDALADHGADDGIEAGAVAAPGQESESGHGRDAMQPTGRARSRARPGSGWPGGGSPPGRRGPHARADSGSGPSWAMRGSQLSRLGRYQFQSPSSVIVAGSSTARTSVASISTATARPTPIILKSSALSVAKIANTAIITTAALETTPAVDLMPWLTASSVFMPRSTASRIRLTMNTW